MTKQIKALISDIIPPTHAWKLELFKQWDEIVGALSAFVFIEKVDQGTLHVGVTHPTWAQELRSLTPTILATLNTRLPAHQITAIKIRFMPRPQPQVATIRHRTFTPQSPQATSLLPQEKKLLACIKSTELQSSIAAYFLRCKTKRGSEKL